MSGSGGMEGSVIGCKVRKARARSGGLSCPPNHPRSLPYGDFDASCKMEWFRAPTAKETNTLTTGLSVSSSTMSPSDLGVFGSVKRAVVAGEACGNDAAAGNTAAAGWLGKSCDARVMRELRLVHRATQGGKQGRAWAAVCHDETYQRCSLDVCQGRTSVCACGHVETKDVTATRRGGLVGPANSRVLIKKLFSFSILFRERVRV